MGEESRSRVRRGGAAALRKVLAVALLGFAAFACRTPEQGGTRSFIGIPAEAGTRQNTAKCGSNATSLADGGCSCATGYAAAGDGGACQDIDECKDPSLNDCDANADCTNSLGSFSCKCKSGYAGDGKHCARATTCSATSSPCDPNATCTAGDSGSPCTCNAGYTGDGFTCTDVDECQDPKLFSCATNAVCENTFGSYTCTCSPGFTGDGKTSCKSLCDVATADPTVCGPNGVCRDDGETGVCDSCAPGFTGDGKTCTASAMCPALCDGKSGGDGGAPDAPHSVCTSTGTCACAPGYTGTPGNCADVNECATNSGGCGDNADCTNTDGGFVCTCKQGFELDSTGKCTAVNVCNAVPGPCHPDATCTAVTPSATNSKGFTCACKPGFSGDGFSCSDIDECQTNNGGCPANATCTNTRGSFTCDCQAPFTGGAGGCYCDLTGTWAVREDVSTCWATIPIAQGTNQDLISTGAIEDTTWEMHQITYDGTTFSVNEKGCGSDKTPDLVSPLFRETYSSYIPLGEYDSAGIAKGKSFAAKNLVPGSNYVTPTEAAVLGIKLPGDPVTATWPDKWEDVDPSAWDDADNDGEPGLTLWPRLPSQSTQSGSGKYSYIPAEPGTSAQTVIIVQRAGCVSVGLRVIGHFEGQVDTCTHMIGTVITENVQGRVHSCTLVPKGTCNPNNPDDCTGWKQDVSCNQSDWTAASTAQRCTNDDLDRLDNNQSQKQNTTATFEMVKLGPLGQAFNCPDVRTALPAISRPAPMITCTTPQ